MNTRKRILALMLTGLMASGIGGGVAVWQADTASAHKGHSRVWANKFIRAHGGIPPCKWEDGSGQPGMCLWDGATMGNGKGDTVVMVPTKPGRDKRAVVLINR